MLKVPLFLFLIFSVFSFNTVLMGVLARFEELSENFAEFPSKFFGKLMIDFDLTEADISG